MLKLIRFAREHKLKKETSCYKNSILLDLLQFIHKFSFLSFDKLWDYVVKTGA